MVTYLQQQPTEVVPDWQKRIDQLNKSAWELRNTNLAKAAKQSQTAYELSQIHAYAVGEAYSLRCLTFCETANSNYEKALLYAFEAIKLFELLKDKTRLADIYSTMSRVYWEMGNYSDALLYISHVLSLAKKAGDLELEAQTLSNSANIYLILEQYQQALDMYEPALTFYHENNNTDRIIMILNNMAVAHHNSGDSKIALQKAHESLSLCKEPIQTISMLDTLGQIYQDVGKQEDALVYLERALDVSTKHDIKFNKLSALLNIGRIYFKRHDFTQALIYLEQSNSLATKLGVSQIQLDSHRVLSEVYEGLEDFETALMHHRQFHKIHTQIFSEDSERQIRTLEARHKTESALQEAESYRIKSEELEEAKEAAEVANQAKSRFLSSMSHELRTPLNGILGYTQILLRDPTLSKSQVDGIQIIQRSGQHLLTLISDILDISKIEANKLELIPSDIDFNLFVNDIVGLMKMRAHQQKVHFDYEPAETLPRGVEADEKRLRQVLINLLGNAIKFTPAQEDVTLKITPIEQDKQDVTLRFEVLDTGVGMKPEDLKKIFRRFEQVGDSKQRSGGTGLGLSISEQLVTAMGGKIQVESEYGSGSRFWFDITLPISTEIVSHPKYVRSMITGYAGKSKLVLVVDDQSTNRAVSRSLLAPLGFEVEEACNGREALEKVQTHQPDLVLMDLIMPVMDGHEAVATIRADKQLKQPNIIAISASVLDGDLRKELLSRCDALLPKPIEADNLLDQIQQSLDLEWIYDENEGNEQYNPTPNATGDVDLDNMVFPSITDLNTLHDHALMGDFDAIGDVITSLDQTQYKLFVDHVTVLIQSFEDEQIIELIQEGLSLSV